jgi:hypothetical protein
LQQSAAVVQSCPYIAHVGGGPASVVPSVAASVVIPASGMGGAVQVPRVLPGANMHTPPGQQSALVVHGPTTGTQTMS